MRNLKQEITKGYYTAMCGGMKLKNYTQHKLKPLAKISYVYTTMDILLLLQLFQEQGESFKKKIRPYVEKNGTNVKVEQKNLNKTL